VNTPTSRLFADVLLPLPLPRPYTYRVPDELAEGIQPGCRVVVQFGKQKITTAVIVKLHDQAPAVYEAKEIMEVLDHHPSILPHQLKLFQWMAEYYGCTQGEVLQAALPSGLKLSSESMVQRNPFFDEGDANLSAREEMILEELKTRQLSYNDIIKITGLKNINPLLRGLIEKEAILLYQEVKEKYSPRVIHKIRIAEAWTTKAKLEEAFQVLEKKGKQTDVLLKYLQMVPVFQDSRINARGIVKARFIESGISASAVNTLVKNGYLEEFDEIISRFADLGENDTVLPSLSPAQVAAKESILEQFKTKEAILLHGITGSGKTELYIHLVKQALQGGSQVLMLLPEIALTTQIVNRLRKVFGDEMGVYHSKYSDNERVEVWKGILSGRFRFVVGVRSAVFLPFDNLGLILIDEEHETSYKQYDPAPRYHARETALMLSRLHHARTLLGSATPSIESYYNAQEGKWGYVPLKERFGEGKLPEWNVIDLRQEKKKQRMKNDFSFSLLESIDQRLQNNEQVIMFQNRRGYAPYLACEDCGHIVKCENCAVSLTYHQYSKDLRCHYCGHVESVPSGCPACGSSRVHAMGFGTEKLEEDLSLFFPQARLQRMDLDTTRNKNSYQEIIQRFENREVDILVGTQMVTKGLDFDHVSLVVIPDADSMLFYPDFRSYERAFQLMTQVSGRAGRKDGKGNVVVQTHKPDHPLFPYILSGDYEGFYAFEKAEREKFGYPPFVRLIKVTLKHADRVLVDQTAVELGNRLSARLGKERVLGPEAPVIERLRNMFLKDIFIKIERDKINPAKIKEVIKEEQARLYQHTEYKKVIVVMDVDPY
jgi:primosomal protein N' (replication factor Y)